MLMDKVVKMLQDQQIGDMTVADLFEVFRDCGAPEGVMQEFDYETVLKFNDGSESLV
tara:strand:- start:701 stop:871 length:171 start_codon:yes stop_codon:yes gene_type:complete